MENLGFLIFRDGEPDFSPSGQIANVNDGDTVSLYHKLKPYAQDKGLDFTALPLKLELLHNGNSVAEHSFAINNKTTTDLWLIADPAATDANGSFTPVFVKYLASLPQGTHNFEIKLYIDGNLFQSGSFVFNSDGQNTKFKEILSRFDNTENARLQSIADHQTEYSKQLAREEAEQRRKYNYYVTIKNENTGKTVYVIAINQVNFLEDRYEIPPESEITLELPKGSEYMLIYFNQDQDRTNSKILTELTDLSDGARFSVM